MLIFGTLIFFAFRSRFNPPEHKRLIIIATTSLTVAAIARWPLAIVLGSPLRAMLFSYIFLLMLVAYDLWSTHKVHRATIWASVFVVLLQQISMPIGKTAVWHSFASWVQSVAR
jgi:FtsH-binding integral membrane protein